MLVVNGVVALAHKEANIKVIQQISIGLFISA